MRKNGMKYLVSCRRNRKPLSSNPFHFTTNSPQQFASSATALHSFMITNTFADCGNTGQNMADGKDNTTELTTKGARLDA